MKVIPPHFSCTQEEDSVQWSAGSEEVTERHQLLIQVKASRMATNRIQTVGICQEAALHSLCPGITVTTGLTGLPPRSPLFFIGIIKRAKHARKQFSRARSRGSRNLISAKKNTVLLVVAGLAHSSLVRCIPWSKL